jgi:hypothetical protein
MVFVKYAHMVRWAWLALLALAAGSCSESPSGGDTRTKRERVALGSEAAASPRVWTEKARLRASDGVADDLFGQVLAAQCNTLVVGGQGDGLIPSRVHVFTGSGANWTEQDKLVPPEACDSFGFSLAISGDTLLVGAPFQPAGTLMWVGVAYVYVRSGSDWTFQQKLTVPNGVSFDQFGFALAIDGDTAVISAPREPAHNGASGVAHVFVRSGTTWTEQQELSSHFFGETRDFGYSVAIAGNEIIVGAPGDEGAFAFRRSGNTWTYYFFLNSLAGGGQVVAMDGETAVIGKPTGVVQYTPGDDRWWEQDSNDLSRDVGPIALSGDILLLRTPTFQPSWGEPSTCRSVTARAGSSLLGSFRQRTTSGLTGCPSP